LDNCIPVKFQSPDYNENLQPFVEIMNLNGDGYIYTFAKFRHKKNQPFLKS